MAEDNTYRKQGSYEDQNPQNQHHEAGHRHRRHHPHPPSEDATPQGYYGVGYQRRLNDPDYLNQGEFHEPGSGQNFHGIGPQDYQRSDDRIYEDVCDFLAHNGDLDAAGIRVKVTEREVTLDGNVPTRGMKRLADEIAESVKGVLDVHNRLTIDEAIEGDETSSIEDKTAS